MIMESEVVIGDSWMNHSMATRHSRIARENKISTL